MMLEKRLKRRVAEHLGTTLPRFDILAALDRGPDGMTMGALSRALLVSNGNVTALVQTLIKDGWASLATAPGDRRPSLVAPPPAGRYAFAGMAPEPHERLARWPTSLEAADQATIGH